MQDQLLKTVTIKTGVVKRLAREKLYYKDESKTFQTKLTEMKSEGADCTLIKKQNEILQESLMMIPDCHSKLVNAIAELELLLEEEQEKLSDTEVLERAETVLTNAKLQLA